MLRQIGALKLDVKINCVPNVMHILRDLTVGKITIVTYGLSAPVLRLNHFCFVAMIAFILVLRHSLENAVLLPTEANELRVCHFVGSCVPVKGEYTRQLLQLCSKCEDHFLKNLLVLTLFEAKCHFYECERYCVNCVNLFLSKR